MQIDWMDTQLRFLACMNKKNMQIDKTQAN